MLITGASRGFGAFLSMAFGTAGFHVVGVGRDKKELLLLKRSIEKDHGLCSTIVADLMTELGQAAVARGIREHDIDVLINNAGVNPEPISKKIAGNIADINLILQTNTTAAIALCVAAHEHFVAQGRGTIININSAAGLKGNFGEAVYCASKFGLRGFSESVKDAWLKQGIWITDVYSGAMATGMASHRSDVKDLIDPQELADFLIGLCSNRSFFVRDISVQKTRYS